jgi:Transketolase, C-terminal domain/Dehydrogenase E1 component
MWRIRAFEERVGRLARANEVHGLVHLSTGQEAVAAGVCSQLRDDDAVYSGHRAHGHALAKGVPMVPLLAELMGRDGGLCRGLGGSMHVVDHEHGFFGATGVVGGNVPLALGSALAARLQGSDAVAVVFFHHYLLTLEHGDVPEGEHVVPLGQANVVREGGDVTIVALGYMLGQALEAAEQLAGEGVQAEVIDPRTLAPLDTATILTSVEKTGRLVVVDQSTRHGSAAAVIAAEVASEGFSSLKAPVQLVTALDATIPYSEPMEQYLLPDAAKIAAAVLESPVAA